MAANTSAGGRLVRFPFERRRDPLVWDLERLLKERWASVVAEPIPRDMLAGLSRLERREREAEQSLPLVKR